MYVMNLISRRSLSFLLVQTLHSVQQAELRLKSTQGRSWGGEDIRPGEGRLVPDSGESHYCTYSLVAVVKWQRRSRYGSKTEGLPHSRCSARFMHG